MKYPLVSIVMPTLNSAKTVRETIHSLIDQSYTRLELIVVDGGSTDETIPIVESYMGEGDLDLIKLSGAAGSMPRSLNAGLSAAKGEFIARMDADDLAYKWRMHDQVHYLVTHPTCDLVGTGVDVFGVREGWHRSPFTHKQIEDMYLINNPFFHPTVMFRRRLFDDGLYYYGENQVAEEDYELWGRLIPEIKCANMDQSAIRYRLHGGNAQYDPRKNKIKVDALTQFCQRYGMYDADFVKALAEFQCANFMRHEVYVLLKDHAHRADRLGLPKLGWIHDAVTREKSYPEFLTWFRKAKGWPV